MVGPYHEAPAIAEQFGVSIAKVHSWIAFGEMVAVNVATSTKTRPRWRISEESLNAFIAARQSRPAAPTPTRSRKRAGGKEYV